MLSDPLEEYTEEKLLIIQKTLPPLQTRTAETGPLDMRYPAYAWTKLHGFAVQSSDKPVKAEVVSIDDALNMAGVYDGMNETHPFSSLWAFHLCHADSRWCVVGRFATVPLPACNLPISDLALSIDTRFHSYDFWEQSYLGIVSNEMPVQKLDIGHCQIIALRPVLDRPQFLASSRHVSMDAVSVKSESWKEPVLSLEVLGISRTTETYIIHRNGHTFTDSRCEGAIMECTMEGELIICNLEFLEKNTFVTLTFSKHN